MAQSQSHFLLGPVSNVFSCVSACPTRTATELQTTFSSPAIFYSCEGKSIKPKQSSRNATNLLNLHPGEKNPQKTGLIHPKLFFPPLCHDFKILTESSRRRCFHPKLSVVTETPGHSYKFTSFPFYFCFIPQHKMPPSGSASLL